MSPQKPMMPTAGEKYVPFKPISLPDRQWPSKVITKAPIWCAVDLRDGNQALIDPMDPSARRACSSCSATWASRRSRSAFRRPRRPISTSCAGSSKRTMIPDDVTIQVLMQCRPELIERTFEACRGAKRAIVHLYNSTSTLQRRVVFGKDVGGINDIAVTGAKLVKQLADADPDTEWVFEYSPESFTGTELEFALEICDAVTDVCQPTPDKQDDHQPAGDGRDGDAQHLCRPDRMVPATSTTAIRSCSACIRTTTAAPASPPPNSA